MTVKKETKAAPVKREPIDWDRIEPDFRANIKSVLQIAADYEKATGRKISHTAINKHFKELGITRDLRAKVKAKADALVSAAMVSTPVATETRATTPTEATIINAGGEVLAHVVLSQRRDIQRNRALAIKLLTELEGQCDNPDLLEQLAEVMLAPDGEETEAAAKRRERMWEQFNRAMSLASRVDTMKKLADTMKTLVGLERVAYGLADDGKNEGAGSHEAWLDSLD